MIAILLHTRRERTYRMENVDNLNSNLQGPCIKIHPHINTLHIYIKNEPHDCQYDHLSIIVPGSML
jgi:hypothetical protein